MKAVVAQAAIVVNLKITYQSQPLHVWHQRAQAGADAVRQHGQGFAREVNGGGAIERLLLRGAVGFDHSGRVGNGDRQRPAGGVGFGQQGIVHVLGARAVDGHIRAIRAVFPPGFPGFDITLTEAVGLCTHRVRPGVGQIKGSQGERAFNTGFSRLADYPQYLGLALAILDRMLVNLTVEVIVLLGVHSLFGGNEDPAVDARGFGHHEMAFAFHQVTANKGVQAGFQQFVHNTLGFAFLNLLLGDIHPVPGQHLLHFLGWQEDIPAFVERNKSEAAIGGFDCSGKNHLVVLDIRFQLAQLAEGVGIEHEVTWLVKKMNDGAEYNGYGGMSQTRYAGLISGSSEVVIQTRLRPSSLA